MAPRVLSLRLAGVTLLASSLLLVAARAQDPAPRSKPYLGIAGETAPPSSNPSGVIVDAVVPDGPAAKAGLKAGDVITKVEGQKVKSFNTLAHAVESHKPGDKIKLAVARDDKERDVEVTLAAQPDADGQFPRPFLGGAGQAPGAFLGVQTQELTPEFKQRLGVKAESGVMVTDVVPNSPAAKAGLQEQDVITALDGEKITNPRELRDAVLKAGSGKEVKLKVERGKESKELTATLAVAPPGGLGGGPFPRLERPGPLGGNPAELLEAPRRVRELEQKVQDLERRLRELEQKLSQSKK